MIGGDSTSRRLMWALCNFLEGNFLVKTSVTTDRCCGTRRVDIYCHLPTVLEHDILLLYNPVLFMPQVENWLDQSLRQSLHFAVDAMHSGTRALDPSSRRRSPPA